MTSEELSQRHFRTWITLVVLLLPALALYIWGGNGADPKDAVPWTWTRTGWIVPAAGLAWLWCFAAILFWLLSELAWLLFHPAERSRKLKVWASAGIIVGVGLLVRILIAATWVPIEPAAGWRWLAVGGDMVVVGLLMLTLAGTGRSLWWSALYAFHPLVLLEIAGSGHWVIWIVLPILFLVGISHRLPAAMMRLLPAIAVLGAVITLCLHVQAPAFNSLAGVLVGGAALPIAIVLLLVILLLGQLLDWPIARTLAHVAVVAIMCSPVAKPWAAVFVAALLPLAWVRAGWVMSLTMLAAYAAIPTQRLGYGYHVPEWLLMLEWVPVWVLEIHEIGAEAVGIGKRSRAKTFPAATSPVP